MPSIIAMCEKRISEFDEHMANTYDLPSALNEIIIRCEAAESERDEISVSYINLDTAYKLAYARAEAAEAQVAQLQAERDTAQNELRELRLSIIEDATR